MILGRQTVWSDSNKYQHFLFICSHPNPPETEPTVQQTGNCIMNRVLCIFVQTLPISHAASVVISEV